LFDAGTYLIDNNLTRVDRASMAFGLEVRVPFLDHRLVEFAFSLPEELSITDGETKVLLRNLAKRRLPHASLAKLKQGFSCPIDRYWRADDMAASIRRGTMVDENIVDRNCLTRLLDGPQFGNTPFQVWILAALDRWCQKWLCGCAV
jgi:asparagine synthase (glutamine-hydrolysing)